MVSAESIASAKAAVRPLTIKDLRVQLRARGLSPAGGRDTLAARLEEHMAATCDFEIKAELSQPHPADAAATYGSSLLSGGHYSNSAQQHRRQQLAPPPPPPAPRALSSTAAAPFSTDANDHLHAPNNNYARPAGQQNVGNYLTGRPSSRVLAPPGGATSIVFGDDNGGAGNGGGGRGGGSRPSSSTTATNSAAAASRPAFEQQQQQYEEDGGAAAEAVSYGVGNDGNVDVDDESRYNNNEGDDGVEPSSFVAAPAPPVPNAPVARVVGIAGIGESNNNAKSASSHPNNNYARSEGQNVGNFISGRPTSRVLAPPGGRSSITFG